MSQLQYGYREAIINPSLSITLAGYQHRFKCGVGNSGILDDLYARALNLKLEDKELMIITLDLCWISQVTADSFREAVSGKLGIPKENIMISASHTHSGPAADISGLKNTNDSHNMKLRQEIELYLEEVKNHILTICSDARFHKHYARLNTTTLKINLGYNRRYPTIDDQGTPSVKMHFNLWQHMGEEINSTVDPDIPVLMIETLPCEQEDDYLEPIGQKRIVIFSVPYHPVVLGEGSRLVSADYPGAARKCIEETLGSGTKAMFLLGACGDINVMMACQENPKPVQIIGKAIGYSVVAALSHREKIEVENLDAIEDYIILENMKDKKIIIQIFKIGKLAIVAVSAECFSELGIKVRKIPDFKQILMATNSNGNIGYLPSKVAFAEGGYEVDSAKNHGFSEDTLDIVIEKIINHLAR